MAQPYRKMIVHGDHLEPPDSGPPWTVLWETKTPLDGRWSTARVVTEQAALERAAHFVKLGFVVHAITNPSGAVVLDGQQIVDRFGAAPNRPPQPAKEPVASSAEQAALRLLRDCVGEFEATPGRVLNVALLRAALLSDGMGRAEFEGAVSYANAHGWLVEATGTLTLTLAGYATATQ
ncbi:MAG TPA: hypothetical protein VMU87_21190 [Stellaceae bacterium]|nr:hypothetical protein [Stellaceae bacterium]